MSDLRQAAQQVLDAWQTSLYGKPSHQKAVVLAMTNLNIVLQQQAEPDRRDLQAAGTHPALCARHCEARAFEIEIRSLKSQLKQQAEPVAWTLTKTLNKRETTTLAYLWFSNPQNYLWAPLYTTPPQRKPLTEEEIRNAINTFKVAENLMGVNHIHVARAIEAAHHIQEPKP